MSQARDATPPPATGHLRVAAIQMVSGPALAPNLSAARTLLHEAAVRGATLAVLPEYFCCMGLADTDKLALRESYGSGPIQAFLAASARELGLWIVGGTLPLRTRSAQHVRNATLVYDPQGRCVARYDKLHLFRLDSGEQQFDEARTIAPGNRLVHFALTARDKSRWRVGLSICYDLRFPELYRALSDKGCDLLLVPSAFTHSTGEAHWEVLLRARAIENLAFVAAAAQGGTHANGRRTWGHSMVVDPWGTVLARKATGPAVICADLDRATLAERRRQLPALSHRLRALLA